MRKRPIRPADADKKQAPDRRSGACASQDLLHGDDIVVNRLSAGENGDFGVRAGGLKDLRGLLGVLLRHIHTVEDADELGLLGGVGPGQPLQQGG